MELLASLQLSSAFVAQAFLLPLRLGAAFGMSPLLSSSAVPRTVRLLVVVGLAAPMTLALPLQPLAPAVLDQPGALFAAACTELALGATLGLGIQLAVAAFTFAGRLLDVQVGFSLVRVFDPLSNTRGAVITTAIDQVGVLLFFLLNVHHVLLRGLAWSIERYPLGRAWPLAAAVGPLFKQVGAMFVLGLALAAPVMFCLLLVELALAVIAHSLPQMNMLVIGFPVKIVVGMVALALWAPGMGSAMARVYQTLYSGWNDIVGLAPAKPATETC